MAGLPESPRAVLEEMRRTIRAAAPEAAETISYGIPTLKDRGRMLVSYAAFKNHCSIFPATDPMREAIGAEIEPYLSGRGTIRFPLDEPVPHPLVARIVQMRLAELAAARDE